MALASCHRHRVAACLTVITVLGGLLVAVQPAVAGQRATIPAANTGSLEYPGGVNIDVAKLPACPAPTPLKKSSTPVLPLNDPAAKHCYIDPIVAGEVGLNGIPIKQHSLPRAYRGDGQPSAPPIAPPPVDPASTNNPLPAGAANPNVSEIASWLNGVTDIQSNLNLAGVAATLFAQQPLFGSAPGSVLNWIGMQSSHQYNADFIQIGIESSNSSYYCAAGGGNTAPEVFFQVALGGIYQQAQCLTNYVFGIGTQTFFAITWDSPNATWDAWINWNNVWQVVNALGPESVLVPGRAYADLIPAETILFGPGGVPFIGNLGGSIADQQGQVYATSDGTVYFWEWWFTYITTQEIKNGPYCPSFPVKYTNVSVNNC